MSRKSRFGPGSWFAAAALAALFPESAYAYLDPGTGSYIFQLAVAAALGGVLATKIFFGKVKTFLGRVFRPDRYRGNPR